MKKVDCKNSLKRARARDAAGGLGCVVNFIHFDDEQQRK